MGVIDEGATRQLSYAWHNACMETIPTIGAQLADRLDQELTKLDTVYEGDDEELLVAIKQICEEYTLRPSQQRSLIRNLKADFYRITGMMEGSPSIPDNRPAFSSMEDMLNALDIGISELAEVRAGRAQVPDIDALFFQGLREKKAEPEPVTPTRTKEQIEDERNFSAFQVDKSQARHRSKAIHIQDIAKQLNARVKEVELVITAQDRARMLRFEALALVLSEARQAGCYDRRLKALA